MFEVGDKVKAFGVDGVVTSIGANDEYPVGVKLTPLGMSSHTDHFDQQGKHLKWHAEPTLVLVEKAKKKKVKKYKYLYNTKHLTGFDLFKVSENYYQSDEVFVIANPLTSSGGFQKLELTEKEFEV